MASNLEQQIEYSSTQNIPERVDVASACVIGLKLSIPTLIDTMDNAADVAYNGWPERLYVLSKDGEVAYQCGKGPYGFDPEALYTFLLNYLH